MRNMIARMAHTLHHLRLCLTAPANAWRWVIVLSVWVGASSMLFHMQPRTLPAQTDAVVTATPAAPQDPSLLSDADAALYKVIYAAQDNEDFTSADTAMAQLANTNLIGHILAARYLDPHYTATTAELSQWLANYADHPEAARIARVAMRHGLDVNIASADEPLKGEGYTDHMGRNTMPDNWYHALTLWREGSYATAQPIFQKVGDNDALTDWQRSAGYYWAYRSAQKQQDDSKAKENLARAALYPTTFYGILASRQLGIASIAAQAPAVSDRLRHDPRAVRAALLASIGRSDDAEDELRHLYSAIGRGQRPGIVTLASEMGLANLQVRLAHMPQLSSAEATFANYPMPGFVVSAQNVMDPALLLAIARNESSFRDDVTSGGGAVGMMQMLPSTARALERRMSPDALALASADGDAQPIADRLSDPTVSIRYGANYLKLLTEQPAIGNNLVHLLAGYNAGPGAVAGWQAAARKVDDPLLYIESIPYAETHNYVMQVMAQYWVYQQLIGENPASLDAMTQGKWPTV
jgi:soluble lytic murein transglycosylase